MAEVSSNCRIIFLSGLWLPSEEESFLQSSKVPLQGAANVFQWNIINALESVGMKVALVNAPFVGSYPLRDKRFLFKRNNFNHLFNKLNQVNKEDINVGFINLVGIKHFSRSLALYQETKNKIKELNRDDEQVVVMGYAMTWSTVEALTAIKKKNPTVKTCLIVPDLPEFMTDECGKKSKFIRKLYYKNIYKKIRNIDSFILLTQEMHKKLNTDQPFLVIEGIAAESTASVDSQQLNDKNEATCTKNIVYTGGISARYGLIDLVDAFCGLTDQDIRLVLCGGGDAVSYVTNKMKTDSRIQYKGYVSREEALRYQREAYVLVNPRKGDAEYTKYSFPSKTIEYMCSGRPLLMYKLPSIPNEYDEHIFYIEGDIQEALEKILLYSQGFLTNKGMKAKKFILETRTLIPQGKKIKEFLLRDIK